MRFLDTPVLAAPVALTNAMADVAGLSIVVNQGPATPFIALAVCELEVTAATAGLNRLSGQILVNGTQVGTVAFAQIADNTIGGSTALAIATGVLPASTTAAPNTVKIQAQKNNAGGTAQASIACKLLLILGNDNVS